MANKKVEQIIPILESFFTKEHYHVLKIENKTENFLLRFIYPGTKYFFEVKQQIEIHDIEDRLSLSLTYPKIKEKNSSSPFRSKLSSPILKIKNFPQNNYNNDCDERNINIENLKDFFLEWFELAKETNHPLPDFFDRFLNQD